MDRAHQETDKIIADTERQIRQIYTDAQRDIRAKMVTELAKMQGGDTPAQRYAAAQKYNRLQKLEAQIAHAIQDANRQAVALAQGAWGNTYALNYNYAAYSLETAADVVGAIPVLDKRTVSTIVKQEFTPFSKMALDNAVDRATILRDVTAQLVTGIMQGESITALSRRIQGVTGKNYANSIRIARTETTRIENAGRNDAYKQGENLGLRQEKEWIATKDGRTRDSHRRADGQRVAVGKPFTVGGDKGEYPGDFSDAAQSINCRCTTVTHLVDYPPDTPEAPRMTYDEWEKTRAGMAANEITAARRRARQNIKK